MHSLIRHSEVTSLEGVSEPSVLQELQRNTFKIIYHLEEALQVIALKSTHYVTANSRVPTTVRHGSSFHRMCPNPSHVPDICPSVVAETIDSRPRRLSSNRRNY